MFSYLAVVLHVIAQILDLYTQSTEALPFYRGCAGLCIATCCSRLEMQLSPLWDYVWEFSREENKKTQRKARPSSALFG